MDGSLEGLLASFVPVVVEETGDGVSNAMNDGEAVMEGAETCD